MIGHRFWKIYLGYSRDLLSYSIKVLPQTSNRFTRHLSACGLQIKSDLKGNKRGDRNDNSRGRYYHLQWLGVGFGLVASLVYLKRQSNLRTTSVLDSCTRLLHLLVPQVQAATPFNEGDAHGSSINSYRQKYNFIADIVEKVSPAVVCIETRSHFRQNAGSGFLISSDGLIVTNAHVVQSAKNSQVTVKLMDGRTYTGYVQVIDRASDLALVKIDDEKLPMLKLSLSGSLRPGEWVVALGSPLSLSNTVTSGIISARRKSSELGLHGDIDYIQTDAPITFGNSGGPLINLDGEAVGVNSMKVAEGISFAIPSDYVQGFLERADEFKKAVKAKKMSRSGYIGISMLTLSPSIAAQLRMRSDIADLNIDYGIFVVTVEPGSPAAEGGLRRFDVITKIDGAPMFNSPDVYKAIEDKSKVTFTVYREGREMSLVIRPRELFA